MKVFIDTSAMLAIFDAGDARHPQASAAWTRIVDGEDQVYSSNYVILETVALLQRRFGGEAVRRFVDDMAPVVSVHFVDADTHQAALAAVVAGEGRSGPSLVDCVSFHLIRLLQIDAVFAYDRHFAARGYTLA